MATALNQQSSKVSLAETSTPVATTPFCDGEAVVSNEYGKVGVMRATSSLAVTEAPELKEDCERLFLQAELHEEAGDLAAAFLCALQAAKQGHASCQVNVGNKYASGEGVAVDSRQAEYWHKRAYQNGHSSGALNLGLDRRSAGRVRSAFFWFRRAADMSDGNAMPELAQMYITRYRKAEATTLLEKASSLGRAGISEENLERVTLLLQKLRHG